MTGLPWFAEDISLIAAARCFEQLLKLVYAVVHKRKWEIAGVTSQN